MLAFLEIDQQTRFFSQEFLTTTVRARTSISPCNSAFKQRGKSHERCSSTLYEPIWSLIEIRCRNLQGVGLTGSAETIEDRSRIGCLITKRMQKPRQRHYLDFFPRITYAIVNNFIINFWFNILLSVPSNPETFSSLLHSYKLTSCAPF